MFCKSCLKFEDKINSSKNYNPRFVEDCSNFQKSAIIEHAKTKMHKKASEFENMQEMQKLRETYKKKMTSPSMTPTGECLRNRGKLSEDGQESLRKLFLVA